jgi:hypothetical protein
MSSLSNDLHPASADALLTADRNEAKYLLDVSQLTAFGRELSAKLASHRFEGDGANRLPRAKHYVTTVYFDTDDGQLYRAACASDDNFKLRAREYYDLHPELTELATDPRQLVRYTPTLWLELKTKSGQHTSKRRVGIPKRDVAAFFEGGTTSEEMRRIQQGAHGGDAEHVLTELAAFRDRFGGPLRAACLVNYRRHAWQDPQGNLRITLDRALSCHAPQADLWSRKHALVREALGAASYEESQVVLEIKSRGALPDWTARLLEQSGARPHPYSKFLTAYRSVRGG